MVLLVIADHASDDGTEAWPSQATIATKASVSIRTVQRCVNSLQSQGFLRMEKHMGGSKNCREDRRPHRYTININKLRSDIVTPRQPDTYGVTLTADTGGLSRPKNHPIEPSNETPQGFIEFWNIYPRKVAKKEAEQAFEKAIRDTPLQEILEGARRFADDPYRHPTFTPYPSTWLNQGRWTDEPLPPRDLTPEEKKVKELEISKKKAERERLAREEWLREQEIQRSRAVPMPKEVKELIRKLH
jgi:hypothetical protein